MFKRILNKIRSWITSFSLSPTCTILVMFDDKPIGAIQSLKINESRSIGGQSEVVSVTLTAYRTRFDKRKLTEVFQKGFVHVAAQTYPLQIIINDEKAITMIQNVWISAMDELYHANDWVIVNEINMEAETIKSEMK